MTTSNRQDMRWRELGDVSQVIDRKVDPQQHASQMYAHYSIPAFDAREGPTFELGSEIRSAKCEVMEGCVLFSKLNPRIPRVWHVDDDVDVPRICSTEFLVLQPNPERIIATYLTWILQSPTFLQAVRSKVQAATKSRERVPEKVVVSTPILIPSLAEQHRIVAKLDEQMAALDHAEKALAEQQRAACLLTAAVLQHVFSGPKSSSWLSARLVTVGTFDAGGTPAKDQQSYWADTGYPFVTGADITSTTVGARNARAHLTQAGLDSGKTAVCPAGTVLVVTRTRVGRIGVAGETVAASQDITAFTCHHNLLPAYVMWYLRKESGHLIAQSRGATIQGLRRSVLENLNIPVPPVPEQKQLIETVEQATHNAALLQEDITHRLATVASMRTALLDAAFSGEI